MGGTEAPPISFRSTMPSGSQSAPVCPSLALLLMMIQTVSLAETPCSCRTADWTRCARRGENQAGAHPAAPLPTKKHSGTTSPEPGGGVCKGGRPSLWGTAAVIGTASPCVLQRTSAQRMASAADLCCCSHCCHSRGELMCEVTKAKQKRAQQHPCSPDPGGEP